MSKNRQSPGRDTGLRGLSDDEVSKLARDKNLSGAERNRYKREEKVRGQRNKQKRQSQISVDIPTMFSYSYAIGNPYKLNKPIKNNIDQEVMILTGGLILIMIGIPYNMVYSY